MNHPAAPLSPPSRRKNPLIRLLSSIWFGVFLLAAILTYSSVISALPPVRWTLEMTDMQAFRNGLFVALAILFVLALLTATLARTRWIAINAGGLIAHIGLLLLASGALVYFGTKVEGNVLLQAPAIVVQARMSDQPMTLGRFRAATDEAWTGSSPRGGPPVHVRVLQVETDGVQPRAANLAVQAGDGQPALVRVTAGPGGSQPIAGGFEVGLFAPEAQPYFYNDEEPALYVRNVATGAESRRPIHGLPIYHEHYLTDDGLLRDSAGAEVPPQRVRPELRLLGLAIPTGWFERWRMPIDVDSEGLPFDVRITGYVPFVRDMHPEKRPDGKLTSVPVLAVRSERRPDLSIRAMSAIRLSLSGRGEQSGWSQTLWCPYSLYPDADAEPVEVRMPGSDAVWELTYSRVRHDLDASIAASRLNVEYFPGERGIRAYRSEIRVRKDGVVTPAIVQTNETVRVGRWTLFQSGFAQDGWSYSILGVGNRVGIWPMNVGWIAVLIGCLYAFYVKPVLIRRARRAVVGMVGAAVLLAAPGCGEATPYPPAQQAAEVDQQMDWSQVRLIAVQEGGRCKTLDSFARESFSDMTGREHLPGLSPLASLMEWLFHRPVYADTPTIKVSSPAIAARLGELLGLDKRTLAQRGSRFSPQELAQTSVQAALSEMQSRPMMRSAVNKVRNAQAIADRLEEFLALVPQPGGDAVAAWHTPRAVLANLSAEYLGQLGLSRADLPAEARRPISGLSPDQAATITTHWAALRSAWLRADAASVQSHLTTLNALLPTLAESGVYPSHAQRAAEARYYASGKFTYGWPVYFLALLVSILALVTGWRGPWLVTIGLLLIALAVHAYGLSLRWYILDRIPVANMFEAVVASAAVGVAIALVVEFFQKTRVLLVGCAATGFMALLLGQFALPGAALGTIPAILDDIQLRLHTVMIITAYALSFLAAIIAVIYLIGYYAVRLRRHVAPVAVAASDAGSAATFQIDVSAARPILAGAAPGDEGGGRALPQWLNDIDWSHLIILNMIFVLLFVGGIVLGAWWADYSWGRPWGWDAKEVFALNTWIIYAILLHLRFVVRNRGLWTAWLSIAGCTMMAFNWFFVNFFISSVHSYA